MGEQCKTTTLTQEVIRRMRNNSREADQEERVSILTTFAVKMYRSGYREEKRREILVAGLKRYGKQLDMEDRRVRSLYRKQHEGKAGRARAKLNGKSDWFIKKPEGEPPLDVGDGSSPGHDPPRRKESLISGGGDARGTSRKRSDWTMKGIEGERIVFSQVEATPGGPLRHRLQVPIQIQDRKTKPDRWRQCSSSLTPPRRS